MSQADIQEKISAARREADGLKDKIRTAKDQTADTSRECRPYTSDHN
jgi:guanine nucleotide-binding protein G(I)/G(S)/G(T) subunit beta-1